ncbi:hypothetical protein SAMN02745146_3328 [Hymenobacter daecheongensis DSM 21074]|uniref:Immunity protein 51 n=1 Tax=Hymenobacter daecheongensis DSM 21074 TaxID=1121955 RepID=A0A1M6JZ35_9BACT|nr:hypothetical protein [Hymenobacter daecheongensis]SHJ51965.1 hypothetical protein SAMN02745146_3328 [Hymenobacter daecheongensis DSM 21074]
MENTFPFKIYPIPEHLRVDDALFGITANVESAPALEGYFYLFEKYGFGGGGPSWEEHISTILEEEAPELLDHLTGYSTAARLLFYADSEATVRAFMRVILPIFADLGKLNKYFSQTDSSDFFE